MKLNTFFYVTALFLIVLPSYCFGQQQQTNPFITTSLLANNTATNSAASLETLSNPTSSPEVQKKTLPLALPEYTMQIVAKKPSVYIGIYCTLAEPISEDSLSLLGKECFEKANGQSYEKVFINWYLEGKPKQGKPWGVTNFIQGDAQTYIYSTAQ